MSGRDEKVAGEGMLVAPMTLSEAGLSRLVTREASSAMSDEAL